MFFSSPKYYCKAAEYSLLFQPSGEILTCHYNRGNILGIYPTNNISEVWNGKKRKELVKSIRQAKFNKGCFACKETLNMGLEHSAGINKYDYIIPSKKKIPVSMEFQLDNICNLECVMCSGEYSSQIRKNREKGEPYISPYDDEFVKQLDNYIPYLKHAAFTGGEPFLFDIYYKIWDRIKILNPDLQIYVSTNGTVLNDRVKEYINKLNFNFAISIDSLNKENYERIRKNAIMEKTLENIEFFNNYCKERKQDFNIKCLVTPLNYIDLSYLYKYFNDKNINIIPKIVEMPTFASINNCTIEELNNINENLKLCISNIKTSVNIQNNRRLNEIILKVMFLMNNTNELRYESNRELKYLIKENIKKSLIQNHKEIEINYLLNRLDIVINSIENDKDLNVALNNLMKLNIEAIINELRRNDLTKFVSRFRQTNPN
ncbi:MAG TPA: radical SAM protein [Bacteroidales bacterium]|nr:radical SAM protein [Bacteroidales bacterium]